MRGAEGDAAIHAAACTQDGLLPSARYDGLRLKRVFQAFLGSAGSHSSADPPYFGRMRIYDPLGDVQNVWFGHFAGLACLANMGPIGGWPLFGLKRRVAALGSLSATQLC